MNNKQCTVGLAAVHVARGGSDYPDLFRNVMAVVAMLVLVTVGVSSGLVLRDTTVLCSNGPPGRVENYDPASKITTPKIHGTTKSTTTTIIGVLRVINLINP